jgi:hypothetical protein
VLPRAGPNICPCLVVSALFVRADHQDGTVGMPDDRVRDASHQSPPYTASTSTTHHYQPNPRVHGKANYRPVFWLANLQVSPLDQTPSIRDLPYPLLMYGLGPLLERFEDFITTTERIPAYHVVQIRKVSIAVRT